MRVIDRIATAWAPYAVTFSHDGTRLAIGGGSWYGFGGIALIDLRTRAQTIVRLDELRIDAFGNRPLTDLVAATAGASHQGGSVSELAFTSDDRHLLASTWTASHRRGPAFVFEVDGVVLRPASWQLRDEGRALTGIVPYGPGAIVRVWNVTAEDTLDVYQWPASLAIDREPGRPALTNHRLVLARGCAITGNHGANNGPAPRPRLQPGLIVRALGTGASSYVHSDGATITAIGSTAAGDVISGTTEGELAQWSWDETKPHQPRVLGRIAERNDYSSELTWAVYHPAAAVGICTMSDGRGVAVSAGGMLATWLAGEPLTSWPLPLPGTVRSVAASPDRSLVAVALKLGGFANPAGVIQLVEIEPDTFADAWRTQRTRELAAIADRERAAGGTFDAATLAVLADALEEAGCRPRVLHHLRTHDRRLRTCWVIDELREQ